MSSPKSVFDNISYEARKIKELREGRGLNQKELGAISGVKPGNISRIESGKQDLGPKTLRKIAKGLDVSLADLVEPVEPHEEITGDSVRSERPRYILRPVVPAAIMRYVRMLIFIQDRDPDQWEHVAAMIKNIHQLVGGGKRGARQKSGE